MADASTDNGAFNGKWMFVGNVANDAKSGKQIRSHLMREYYRKERWKKCLNHQQQSGGPLDDTVLEVPQDRDTPPTKKSAKKAIQVSGGVNKRKRVDGCTVDPMRRPSITESTRPTPSVPSRTVSSSSLPPLQIPSTTTTTVLPYVSSTSPPPEHLPEPLFCPPLPKRSDDLSSASETAYSAYTPGGTFRIEEERALEKSLSKAKAMDNMRSLAEDFYIRRPSLCGSPGSEIYVGPFGYLPIKLNPTDHAVLQYYPRVPELVYGIEPNNRFAVHKTVFLPIAFLYPESLYMCLASSNLYMRQRYGVADESLTTFYKQKAYARIQDNMNRAESRYADSVVAGLCGSAVISLGVSTDSGDLMEFMTHMMGLSQVMRRRGGQQSLLDNPRLDMGYTSIILIVGKTWSDCLGKVIPEGFETYAKADIFDFLYETKQLAGWLRQASRWATSLVETDSIEYATTPKQADVFRREESLYRVLDRPRALVDSPPRRVMFERSHHTFAIIYLALAMYEFRDQPEEKDAFIDIMLASLKHNDISKAYTTTSLAWMLLQIFPHQPERNWLTLTISKVVWRLNVERFEVLKNFLLWLICPNEELPPRMTEEMIQAIETDALRELPFL